MRIAAISLILLLLLLVIVSGCSKVYVCYDGSEEKIAQKCPTVPYPSVSERDASQAVDKFGGAYALSKGDRFTRVNIYWENSHWYSDVLFTDIKTEVVNRARLKVDGKTSSITCIEGCAYLGLKTDST